MKITNSSSRPSLDIPHRPHVPTPPRKAVTNFTALPSSLGSGTSRPSNTEQSRLVVTQTKHPRGTPSPRFPRARKRKLGALSLCDPV